MSTVADCALLCLDLTACQTAIFNNQMGTCTMFSGSLGAGGQLAPASSNDVTTISVEKETPSSNIFINPYNNTVYAVWNVSAGEDSTPAFPGMSFGNYWYVYSPSNVFDGNLTTVFCIYGICNLTDFQFVCGQNTGVYVTTQQGPFVLKAFRIGTGHYGNNLRDPIIITLEGSNQIGSALVLGSSWTLIYNGTSGLLTDPGRSSYGVQQIIPNNTMAFASYRFLVVEKRGVESCVEYSEVQLFSS